MSHKVIKAEFWHGRIETLKNRGISPLTAIDIGANVGEWYQNFKSFFPHANVLSVEANPQHESQLKQVNPNSITLLMGRENDMDGVEFYINPDTENDVGASIYREATQWGQNAYSVNLPMRTLDSLEQKFDWIKVDVQGAELDVLEGGGATLQHAMIVELELSTMRYNEGAPLAGEVITWMWESGFELYDITEHIYVEEDENGIHNLGQLNVLFLNRKYSHLLDIKG